MGEPRVWYGPGRAAQSPCKVWQVLHFISTGNLPQDLEPKVSFRANSAPFWREWFLVYHLQIRDQVKSFPSVSGVEPVP